MRPLILGLAIALALAACAPRPTPPLVDAPLLEAAYAAYRDGEYAVLDQIRADADARAADPAIARACDAQGYAERRLTRVRDRLKLMDGATATSLSENARFVHLEGLLVGGQGRGKGTSTDPWPTDFECEKDPGYDESRRIDDRERLAVNQGARDFLGAWRKDLRARLGEQFEPEMKRAAKLLHGVRLRDDWNWGVSEAYD